MKKEIKAEWLRRLRSGEIKQVSGRLGDVETGGRCCLGVLCDIAVDRGVVIARPVEAGDGRTVMEYGAPGGVSERTMLPLAVRQWAEVGHQELGYGGDVCLPPAAENDPVIRHHNGSTDDPDGYELSLPYLNDSGASFAQIADLIEEYL